MKSINLCVHDVAVKDGRIVTCVQKNGDVDMWPSLTFTPILIPLFRSFVFFRKISGTLIKV